MQLRVGCELIYRCAQPTPMILTLSVHYTRAPDMVRPDHLVTQPSLPIRQYRDGFGNWCSRVVAPPGLTTTCPSCHGSGRKVETTGFHDVTKTKPSHHRQTNRVEVAEKPQWPVTFEGEQLAAEVRDSKICTAEVKTRLIREVMEHEASHGVCTQTFIKKVRKQIRPRVTP